MADRLHLERRYKIQTHFRMEPKQVDWLDCSSDLYFQSADILILFSFPNEQLR